MRIPTVSDRYPEADVRAYYAAGCWSTDTFSTLLAGQGAKVAPAASVGT
jgi:non-ribosomal peptide synthetase component E (peptide arylation enzyme)